MISVCFLRTSDESKDEKRNEGWKKRKPGAKAKAKERAVFSFLRVSVLPARRTSAARLLSLPWRCSIFEAAWQVSLQLYVSLNLPEDGDATVPITQRKGTNTRRGELSVRSRRKDVVGGCTAWRLNSLAIAQKTSRSQHPATGFPSSQSFVSR